MWQIWWCNCSSQFRSEFLNCCHGSLISPFWICILLSVTIWSHTGLIFNIRGEKTSCCVLGSGGRACKSLTTIWCVIANTEKCQSLQGHLFLCGKRWMVQVSGCMEWWNTSHTRRQITTLERGRWEECVCVSGGQRLFSQTHTKTLHHPSIFPKQDYRI